MPRPKLAKLSKDQLERFHCTTAKFVEESAVLRELVDDVQLSRGRIYFWRADDDAMARVTPLSSRTFLLEAPWRNGWTEQARGPLRDVLVALASDTTGKFHGLGALATKSKGGGSKSPQQILHGDFKVPLQVLAEPRGWYAMRRKPRIIETDRKRGRVLVRFEALGPVGAFHGTCLYARVDGEWSCFTVKPSASASIASAEAWLVKRGWEDWG
ncbi:MAG TPA: hypothetical protein VF331_19345 [Polyangiales bacterium]